MMNAKDTSKYTPQQLADAERFMQLLSRVPEDKRDAVIQNTELKWTKATTPPGW